MGLPPPPSVNEIVEHFAAALRRARRNDVPYRHWTLDNVFPDDLCIGILTLPIAPPMLGETDGTRGNYNDRRTFLTLELQQKFPVLSALADALQRPETSRLLRDTCNIEVSGSFLRMEYMQDTDGAWLEPHRDIPEKLFSMVIYFCTGPEAKDWGTDIYDTQRRWFSRSSAEFNSGVIFVPGADTWHGFERRPIHGVRRLMEINYVRPTWRDREQLSFPHKPISAS